VQEYSPTVHGDAVNTVTEAETSWEDLSGEPLVDQAADQGRSESRVSRSEVATEMKARRDNGRVMCEVCNTKKRVSAMIPAWLVQSTVSEKIKAACPDWSSTSYICHADLNRFRGEYIEDALRQDIGELAALEAQVLESLKEQELMATNLNVEFEQQLSLGEKLADKLAYFGGSWKFIGTFGALLFCWIIFNTAVFLEKPFDPYPYILLNLLLSCLAAFQAPVIMMSQNRQESKDRLRAEHDYKVNLKAELEIRHLHDKIDHFGRNQWQRLLEIQKIQADLMEELSEKGSRS
jgi:uncharacterized membrane protein